MTNSSPIQPDVAFANPTDDPPKDIVVEIVEGLCGHAVAEIVAPAPQYRIKPAQQLGESSVTLAAGKPAYLVNNRIERVF